MDTVDCCVWGVATVTDYVWGVATVDCCVWGVATVTDYVWGRGYCRLLRLGCGYCNRLSLGVATVDS